MRHAFSLAAAALPVVLHSACAVRECEALLDCPSGEACTADGRCVRSDADGVGAASRSVPVQLDQDPGSGSDQPVPSLPTTAPEVLPGVDELMAGQVVMWGTFATLGEVEARGTLGVAPTQVVAIVGTEDAEVSDALVSVQTGEPGAGMPEVVDVPIGLGIACTVNVPPELAYDQPLTEAEIDDKPEGLISEEAAATLEEAGYVPVLISARAPGVAVFVLGALPPDAPAQE